MSHLALSVPIKPCHPDMPNRASPCRLQSARADVPIPAVSGHTNPDVPIPAVPRHTNPCRRPSPRHVMPDQASPSRTRHLRSALATPRLAVPTCLPRSSPFSPYRHPIPRRVDTYPPDLAGPGPTPPVRPHHLSPSRADMPCQLGPGQHEPSQARPHPTRHLKPRLTYARHADSPNLENASLKLSNDLVAIRRKMSDN